MRGDARGTATGPDAGATAWQAAMTPEQVVEATSLSAGTAVVYDTADGPTVLGVLSEWIDCDAPEPVRLQLA